MCKRKPRDSRGSSKEAQPIKQTNNITRFDIPPQKFVQLFLGVDIYYGPSQDGAVRAEKPRSASRVNRGKAPPNAAVRTDKRQISIFAVFLVDIASGLCYHISACGCSLVVKHELPKLRLWVRFPSPAPFCRAFALLFVILHGIFKHSLRQAKNYPCTRARFAL